MIVVLPEFLHAEETVHLPGLLLPVEHIVLGVADRKLPVGAVLPLIGEHGIRAVHGLCRHCVHPLPVIEDGARLNLYILRLFSLLREVLQNPRNLRVRLQPAGHAGHHEHIVDVVRPVSADQPELLIVDERCGDLSVAVPLLDLSRILEEGLIHLPASREPVGHTGSGLVKEEELQLGSELLMIPLLCLLHEFKMRLQSFLVREGVEIDPLELVPVLIPSPVGPGGGLDLEGRVQKLLGILHMGAATEIHEVIPCMISGDDGVLRQILDDLLLKALILKKLERLLPGELLSRPGLLSPDDLPHLVLDLLEVLLHHRPREHKIIVAAVLDLRPDRILHILPVELNDRLRKNMCERVPVY